MAGDETAVSAGWEAAAHAGDYERAARRLRRDECTVAMCIAGVEAYAAWCTLDDRFDESEKTRANLVASIWSAMEVERRSSAAESHQCRRPGP